MTSGRCMLALAACVELAERNAPISVHEISERLGASVSYLEQIFAQLKDRGIVTGIRGPGGGYILTDKPSRISALDVVFAATIERKQMELVRDHPAVNLLMNQVERVMAEIGLSDLAARTAREAA